MARSSPRSAAPPPSPFPTRPANSRLKQLPPGPYLVRVHLAGFLAARSTMVNVRPSTQSASSFTLRREGVDQRAACYRSVGRGDRRRARGSREERRSRRERAWLAPPPLEARRAARGATRSPASRRTMTGSSPIRSSSSAARSGPRRAPRSRSSAIVSLGGQVNLLTTGAFDNPLQLLQLDRTSSVAFFSVGAPVGSHGDWNVRAAMNQSDLSSWMLAGSYVVKAQVPHRYRFGMSYSLQRYEGGNTAALGALVRHGAQRRLGVRVRRVANLPLRRRELRRQLRALRLHGRARRCSARASARRSRRPQSWRLRASASRDVSAPGAEEFIPPIVRGIPAAAAHLLAALEGRACARRSCRTTSSPSSAS